VTPVTQAQSLRLIAAIRAGDQEALNEMVKAHIPLVKACIRRFQGCGRDMEELYQQGCLGLLKACRRFDPAYQVCFSTYAVPLILGEVRRFLRDDQPIHLVRQDKERLARLPSLTARLTRSLGREPTVNELALNLRMEPAELMLLMESRHTPLSLDYEQPGERSYSEKLAEPESWLDMLLLKDMLQRLAPQDRKLVYLRFKAGKTQAQTAQALGVSQVQVSRLERRIRAALKAQWHTG